MYLALAGGVGGAKLAAGLAATIGERLTVVVNTGDDFRHLGLCISPDLDTVLYTLAGLNDPERGWGVAGETWNFMHALARLGGEDWFQLGDQDLALHVERTRRLASGESLSEVTEEFRRRLGIAARILPMSDDSVETRVETDRGILSFQEYFVRYRCEPRFLRSKYLGVEAASPSPGFAMALKSPKLRAVIICPSNPVLSIEPILSVPGVRPALASLSVPVIAVSPIVANEALKGPAAKILREMGGEVSARAVALRYLDILDGFVIDDRDAHLANDVEALGMRCLVTGTIMRSSGDRATLADRVLRFAAELGPATTRLQ